MAAKPRQFGSLDELVRKLVESYQSDKRISHLDSTFLPNRDKTIEIIELVRRLIFPGYFDENRITSETAHKHVHVLLDLTRELLYQQVRESLRYIETLTNGKSKGDASDHLDDEAARVTEAYLHRLPELRRLLALDVQAGYDGDPAAASTDEIVFSYPGLDAIFIYRIAHELHVLKVPLLPRIMTEYAHNETGIDIHPGATIGESFFIDHGTGVVIGETTIIGNHVKLYHGVTLGALSTRDVEALRGRKRHPTIKDDVTIYPNATILGGETVIGEGATVNGGIFLTKSVPPGHTVAADPPVLQLKDKRRRKGDENSLDFQV